MAGDCILCGKCLEVCPLFGATNREELSPRAKADLARLLKDDETRLKSEDVTRLASLCLGCHRCKGKCSQGVDVPGLVAVLRSAHPDFKSWLWKTWLTHAQTLWSVSSTAAGFVPESFTPEKFGPFLKMLAGMKAGSGLEPFLEATSFPNSYQGAEILLFAGCTATYVQRRWLDAARRLLDGLGVEVLSGDFVCCGAGLKGAGCAAEAEAMAARNVAVWREAGKPKIVTFCASCRAGLFAYDCFDDEKERVAWAASLVSLAEIARSAAFVVSSNAPERIGYHRPCHTVGSDSDFILLRHALGDHPVLPKENTCCGFGGLMRLAAPELSERVNADCWQSLGSAEAVLTGCSACVTQLAVTAPEGVRVGHWLEIIR